MEEQQELKYSVEDVLIVPDIIEAVVTGMKLVKADSIFGEKAKQPEKDMISVNVVNERYGISAYLPLSYFENGKVPDNSKLGKLLKRYGSLAIGSKLKIDKTNNEFWEFLI